MAFYTTQPQPDPRLLNRLDMLERIYYASTPAEQEQARELARELIVAEGEPEMRKLPKKYMDLVRRMYDAAPSAVVFEVQDDSKIEEKLK